MRTCDVAVVGGGVAGAATAALLAGAGCEVLVLERATRFVDRVRGELMPPWGVREVLDLGLLDVLFAVPFVNVMTRAAPFDETVPVDIARRQARDVTNVLPGIPGFVGVSHPGLSEAVLAHATKAGAVVHRGVEDIEIEVGAHPAVTFTLAGERRRATCRLLVGADGRESTVRRQLGWPLESTTPRIYMGGMLVDGTEDWPRDLLATGVEDDVHFLIFPQGGGLTRLYLGWDAARPHRFAGPGRERRFLEAFRRRCIAGCEALADARPAGPCAAFPMTDTWLGRPPYAEGVVLIGDAAGWSDPIIGQGLSVAFRDVHLVTDALLGGSGWSTSQFEEYGHERAERMRRLRFSVSVLGLTHGFDESARARRVAVRQLAAKEPLYGMYYAGIVAGPWRFPEAAFSGETYDVLANAASTS
jgi:2-polyprenyl-6-methoxyphenol hydroxylase-like FAD-dependent oxidoreductase